MTDLNKPIRMKDLKECFIESVFTEGDNYKDCDVVQDTQEIILVRICPECGEEEQIIIDTFLDSDEDGKYFPVMQFRRTYREDYKKRG